MSGLCSRVRSRAFNLSISSLITRCMWEHCTKAAALAGWDMLRPPGNRHKRREPSHTKTASPPKSKNKSKRNLILCAQRDAMENSFIRNHHYVWSETRRWLCIRWSVNNKQTRGAQVTYIMHKMQLFDCAIYKISYWKEKKGVLTPILTRTMRLVRALWLEPPRVSTHTLMMMRFKAPPSVVCTTK